MVQFIIYSPFQIKTLLEWGQKLQKQENISQKRLETAFINEQDNNLRIKKIFSCILILNIKQFYGFGGATMFIMNLRFLYGLCAMKYQFSMCFCNPLIGWMARWRQHHNIFLFSKQSLILWCYIFLNNKARHRYTDLLLKFMENCSKYIFQECLWFITLNQWFQVSVL